MGQRLGLFRDLRFAPAAQPKPCYLAPAAAIRYVPAENLGQLALEAKDFGRMGSVLLYTPQMPVRASSSGVMQNGVQNGVR